MQTDPHKLYYTIGEVAAGLSVKPSLIRFWETEFPMLRPKKSHRGNRKFTHTDIQVLEIIYRLVKKQGYTIEGAKQALKQQITHHKQTQTVIDKLQSIKAFLVDLRQAVQQS